MRRTPSLLGKIAICSLCVGGYAQAQIRVTEAQIGCLDLKENNGNLTTFVANACNGKMSCSYKAPTEGEYKRMGVNAHTRTFCTQGMEIEYHCASGPTQVVVVPGNAWDRAAAELACKPLQPPAPPGQGIHVTEAQIGCLDLKENNGNLTTLVANACNNRPYCSYKAPTEDEYRRMGVQAHTRTLCSQAMEITYQCRSDQISVTVDGNAWDHHPAELTCEPLLPAPLPQPAGARLRGFVDLHTHPLSNLGFGGKLVYGGVDIGSVLPADPDCHKNVRAGSVDQALGHDTSTHGGNNYTPAALITTQCGDEVRKLVIHAFQGDFTGDFGEVVKGHAFTMSEDAHGAPDFTDWPLWNDVTHQKMWVGWIRRAYDAGLRVMVALAVNNKTLGDAVSGKGDYPTDDKASADLQIAQTKAFVGRHPDFMEIAFTASDLERIVRANKLAVVLGVEIDNIGDLNMIPSLTPPPHPDAATPLRGDQELLIRGEIDRLFNEGVRYIFPIHLLDNAFGGTAAYTDEFNFSTLREDGHYWALGCAPVPANPTESINYRFDQGSGFVLPRLLDVAAPKLHTPFPWPWPPIYLCGYLANKLGLTPRGSEKNGQTNMEGLTPQGQFAIKEMMRRGILIDIDHMSDKSKTDTIAIADNIGNGAVAGYPLNSGHSGLRGFFPNGVPTPGDINERSTNSAQYDAIAKLHGMAGIGSAHLNAYQWAEMYRVVLAEMKNAPGGAVGGFGTDLNGLEVGMPPDTEQDAERQNPKYLSCVQQAEKGSECTGDLTPSALAACRARAEATCAKEYPPSIMQCVANCGHPRVQYSSAFPMSTLGNKSWDYNAYGVAHYGMLADFLQDVKTLPSSANVPSGASLIDNNLMYGADYFLQTWKKCEALKASVK